MNLLKQPLIALMQIDFKLTNLYNRYDSSLLFKFNQYLKNKEIRWNDLLFSEVFLFCGFPFPHHFGICTFIDKFVL